MPPAARLGDMHTCPMVTPGVPPVPHVGGPILPPCAPTVLIGNMPAARVTDMATCVGPPDVIAMGSPTVFICNLMAARIGDPTVHGGVIVMGCPTVIIGEVGMGAPVVVAPSAPGLGGSSNGSSEDPETEPAPANGASAASGPSPLPGAASADSPPPPPLTPPEKTWIGLDLRDFDDNPVPNQKFRFVLEKGQVLSGVTDAQGRARIEGVDPDSGRVFITDVPEDQEYQSTRESSVADSSSGGAYGPIRPGIPGKGRGQLVSDADGEESADDQESTGDGSVGE